jgi:hypothetical protein
VIAENSSISDFQPPEAPLEIPEFNKLAIDYHDVQIFIPEGTQDPFQLFSLFFTPQLLNMFVTATNSYAQRDHSDTKHPWKLLSLPELYVYLGCLIYQGVHPESDMDDFWRTTRSEKGPLHELSTHIGSTRFYQ